MQIVNQTQSSDIGINNTIVQFVACDNFSAIECDTVKVQSFFVYLVKDNGAVVYSVIDKEYHITNWVQKILAPIIGSKATAAVTEAIEAEVDESAEVPQPINPSKTTEVDPPND